MTLSNKKIAVVGLGYVGLPLAVELAKHYTTFGYDHQPRRINKLQELLSAAASDPTVYAAAEGLSNADLIAAKKLQNLIRVIGVGRLQYHYRLRTDTG